MLKSNLCDYSDAYIHVKEIMTIPITASTGEAANNDDKNVIFKNCTLFTHCTSEITMCK